MAENEHDFGLELDDDDDDKPESLGTLDRRPAASMLPLIMLDAALTGRQRRRFLSERGIAVVIKAPTADWAAPLLAAAKEVARWSFSVAITAPERNKSKDDINASQVLRTLGSGQRTLGVSQSPERCLPASLVSTADLIVAVPFPSDDILRLAIRAVTGRAPRRMPDGIATGLDYATVCACIRRGSTAAQCIARLTLASRDRFAGDDLAAVPELGALHGYGEAMDWAQRLLGDLDAWRRGEIAFADIERAIVLASAPGLGKTTFVRSLAKSARLPLFASSVGAWFSNGDGHLGDVIKQIDRLFVGATAVAPAIVFLDEVEALPDRRRLDGRNSDWWLPVIGHMLTTLDGAGSSTASRLIVIGATNHPEKLDPALVRPGRLNRVIHIPPPDAHSMAGILRQHLGADLPEADLTELAALRVGATGAEAAGWIKTARAIARHQGRPLRVEDLADQIAPANDWSPDMTWRIAVHEAAHAVVMQVLGVATIDAVTIVGVGNTGGRTSASFVETPMTKDDSDDVAVFVLAGMCGEQVLLGAASSGAGGSERSDLARATEMVAVNHASLGLGATLVHRATPEEARRLMALDLHLMVEVEKDLRRLHTRCTEIVTRHRATIERVANALVAERHLTGARFREVFEDKAAARTKRIGGHHG